jgi:hypothetical protein
MAMHLEGRGGGAERWLSMHLLMHLEEKQRWGGLVVQHAERGGKRVTGLRSHHIPRHTWKAIPSQIAKIHATRYTSHITPGGGLELRGGGDVVGFRHLVHLRQTASKQPAARVGAACGTRVRVECPHACTRRQAHGRARRQCHHCAHAPSPSPPPPPDQPLLLNSSRISSSQATHTHMLCNLTRISYAHAMQSLSAFSHLTASRAPSHPCPRTPSCSH